ncbi:MAG: PadR family transcriptional regulator [Chloroflexi bacterium]|nr:PadR family transcriptional regulator [Chloroflexota bacterium]
MSLAHAILGLLNYQPMSGYDLKHLAFDRTIAHFWPADQAQIYRTLDKMAGEGWIAGELEVQSDRPNRRVFTITEAGRAELDRWLHTPQAIPAHREAFLVQMFFAAQLPDAVILEHIDQQIAARQARLDQFGQIIAPSPDEGPLRREQVFWRLTLEFGLAHERMCIEWLELSKQTIRSAAQPPDTKDAPHEG